MACTTWFECTHLSQGLVNVHCWMPVTRKSYRQNIFGLHVIWADSDQPPKFDWLATCSTACTRAASLRLGKLLLSFTKDRIASLADKAYDHINTPCIRWQPFRLVMGSYPRYSAPIWVIDHSLGVLKECKRHSGLSKLLGVRYVVVKISEATGVMR